MTLSLPRKEGAPSHVLFLKCVSIPKHNKSNGHSCTVEAYIGISVLEFWHLDDSCPCNAD